MTLREKAKALVAQMSLVEKASLCSGKNFWSLKGIARLGLPEITLTDGPHGLRKQAVNADQMDISRNIPAVCFPTSAALACSFDRALAAGVGRAIAEECRQENVAVLLGPGVNIKRSPLCGRNFEYFSEDPLVSGELAAAWIEGVQSQGVGASLKHFAGNNQETRRLTVEAVIDERTFREIYVSAFERAVKKARPWTVMASYNKIMGEFSSQNRRLLCGILREEWGYEGAVVSDWGAVVERVPGVAAGMDIEMPEVDGINDGRIVRAVEEGRLSEQAVDASAERIVELILRTAARAPLRYDAAAHHALARQAAAQSAVLLKNDGGILPGSVTNRAAVIGAFARQPRYQGTGSSKINPVQLDIPWDELARCGLNADYAVGYRMDSGEVDEALIAEACRIAEGKDIVYLFAGLPDRYEAETFDRDSMAMPANQVQLIEAVSQVNPRTVVILQGGAPMELAWADQVPGILLMYLGGEAGGGACADLLLGKANPCGKLAESWPFTAADAPSSAYFPGYPQTVEYREGLFVGYRYYDTARKAVRYPFGHGLSYTEFEYSELRLSAASIREDEPLKVSCRVTNRGPLAGSEIVQLYVSCRESVIIRPDQELRGFEKVHLAAGESREVSFTLSKRDFAYYNTAIADWAVESGSYEVRIGASSRDIRLAQGVQVQGNVSIPLPDLRQTAPGYYDLSNGMQISDADFVALLGYPLPLREREKGSPHTITSTINDIQDRWLGRLLLAFIHLQLNIRARKSPDLKMMGEKTIPEMPLHFLTMGAGFSIIQIEGLVEMLNGHFFKGLWRMLRKNDF